MLGVVVADVGFVALGTEEGEAEVADGGGEGVGYWLEVGAEDVHGF